MDSAVALAVMRKAQLVFETEGTFLSFPLGALQYERSDFDFLGADMTVGRLIALREFSQEVDRTPRGPIAPPAGEDRLSEVYADVLQSATLASSARTDDEEAAYQEAIRFLYVIAPDERREDSAALKAYKQYRDASYAAQEDYNSRKIGAEFSSDPAARLRWEEAEAPALRGHLDELQREWTAKGFRVEVEQARHVEETLGAKSPPLMWAEWRKQFNPDLDKRTDASTNQSFFPSVFSPSNAFDADTWPTFTLTGDAVHALARDAPAELRGRLGDQADIEIESLSFEFTSLRVERSWFAPSVFRARYWTFADSAKQLSTGTVPPGGVCPSYVAAVVIARKLAVTLKPRSQRNEQVLARLPASSALAIGNFPVVPMSAAPGRPVRLSSRPAVARRIPVASPPAVPTVSRRTVGRTPSRAAVTAVAPGTSFGHLQRTAFATPLRRTAAPAPRPPDHPPAGEEVRDDLHVMAFICKRLPRCPNPDPNLRW